MERHQIFPFATSLELSHTCVCWGWVLRYAPLGSEWASKRVSKQANIRISGPLFSSRFLAVVNLCALPPSPSAHHRPRCGHRDCHFVSNITITINTTTTTNIITRTTTSNTTTTTITTTNSLRWSLKSLKQPFQAFCRYSYFPLPNGKSHTTCRFMLFICLPLLHLIVFFSLTPHLSSFVIILYFFLSLSSVTILVSPRMFHSTLFCRKQAPTRKKEKFTLMSECFFLGHHPIIHSDNTRSTYSTDNAAQIQRSHAAKSSNMAFLP